MRLTSDVRVANLQVGSAERDRQTKRLSVKDGDIRAIFTGRPEQAERDRIGDNNKQRACSVNVLGQVIQVLGLAEEVRGLHDQRSGIVIQQISQVSLVTRPTAVCDDPRVMTGEIGFNHVAIAWVHPRCEGDLRALVQTEREQARLSQGRCTVIMAGIGDLHAGQLADHGLVLEHGLQHALAQFRLVRCVGGVELGALQDEVDGGRDVVSIASTTEKRLFRGRHLVSIGQFLQGSREFRFAQSVG